MLNLSSALLICGISIATLPSVGTVVLPVLVPMATPLTPPTPPAPQRLFAPVVAAPSPTPTPPPTPTARPTATPLTPPKITFFVGTAGGAYGLFELGEPITITASIYANPDSQFPFVKGGLVNNLRISVRDERSRTIAPVRKATTSAPEATASDVALSATPLSAWGYDLQKPGRYHISFAFASVTTDWAIAHRYLIDNEFFGNIRLVEKYTDVDRHFFPRPKGWSDHDLYVRGCLTARVSSRIGQTIFPTMALTRSSSAPNECFLVYRFAQPLTQGVDLERQAIGSDNVLLSEDDDRACGWEHETTFMYERRIAPFIHTEAVLLRLADGYIVARYTRPNDAPDDAAAENALDAPCLVL